jgi:2'-5' RNA ligase
LTRLRRAFVAVVPPREVLDAVEDLVAPLRSAAPPALRWMHAGQWHLTLQFLGSVDDADALVDALVRELRGVPPVRLALGGAGAFGPGSRSSVVWIGIAEGGVELAALAAAVGRATASLGYEAEGREFAPHLTVARSNPPRSLTNLVRALGDGPVGAGPVGAGPVGPAWDVTEVVLMQSDTRPDGAVYDEVARVALGA